MPEPIGIMLLCAGRGSRFGPEPKLLSLFDGKPLVRHAAETAIESGLGPVIAVLGAEIPPIRDTLDGLALDIVQNPLHADGLSTSLRVGLEALRADIAGVIVMLGDMPRIRPNHLHGLAAAFRAADPQPAAVVPVHAGRRGNPVLLNRVLLATALARLSGDRGAGPLIVGRDDVMEIAMDEAVRQDVDTPAALEDLARR